MIFERLVKSGAHLAHDAAAGRERSVNEFVAIFAGLTATAKRKAATDAAGLSRAPLSRLLNSLESITRRSSGCSAP